MNRYKVRAPWLSIFLIFANAGCSTLPGEEVGADASSEEVGVSSASLTQAQRNELTCLTMSYATPGLNSSERESFRRGCVLFHNEDFGGNGRTCVSCHLLNVGNGNPDDNNFDLSIEDAEAVFVSNPSSPLFRELDSDDGLSAAEGGINGDYSRLRTLADVRIPLDLHPNVAVAPDSSGLISPDGRNVEVWRSTPTSENVALFEANGFLMWDGRFSDAEVQAAEAVIAHYETHLSSGGRLPTAAEAEDIANFQRNLFSNEFLRVYAQNLEAWEANPVGPPPARPLPPEVPSCRTVLGNPVFCGDYWDSARRGRNFFLDMPVSSDNPVRGGHCATCHSGAMLNETNAFNPVQAPGQIINNNLASELNFLRPPETQLPVHTYQITLDHQVFMPDVPIAHSPFFPPPGTPIFPSGAVFTITSTDLGLLLTQGNPCLVPTACLLNSTPPGPNGEPPVLSTASFFRTSSLWGAADSAPYFHDNSARTIEEAMAVYVFNFGITADGLNSLGLDGEPLRLHPQDVEDIINYFEYGFRHRTVLLP